MGQHILLWLNKLKIICQWLWIAKRDNNIGKKGLMMTLNQNYKQLLPFSK